MFGPYIESRDGFESQFSTNYLGHFLLTHFLLPQLKAGGAADALKARIVNVSSCAHLVGEINFEDINNRFLFKFYCCFNQLLGLPNDSASYLINVFL